MRRPSAFSKKISKTAKKKNQRAGNASDKKRLVGGRGFKTRPVQKKKGGTGTGQRLPYRYVLQGGGGENRGERIFSQGARQGAPP